MKIEVDTVSDSVEEISKTIALLQEILEKRTGTVYSKHVVTPYEVKKEEPKIIFEDIMSKPSRSSSNISIPVPKEKVEIKKRKVLKQDEHVPKEEEEDEDRFLPKIQYKDFW